MLSYVAALGATVTVSGGVLDHLRRSAAIRTTLDSFSVTPPADADADFSLTIAGDDDDDSGVSSATTTGAIAINVKAAADAPTISATAAGAEDSAIPLALAFADTDTDGSQSITSVRIAGVPAGATLGWTNAAGATVTNVGGVYEITGSEAAIRQVASTLTLTPLADLHGTVPLSVTVTSTETAPAEAGDVAAGLSSASTTTPLAPSSSRPSPTRRC